MWFESFLAVSVIAALMIAGLIGLGRLVLGE
jgi:hypothetical protein